MKRCIYVLVKFLPADEGGRIGPIYLNGYGYNPHFRIIGDTEYLGVNFIECLDVIVRPKEWVTAKVWLIYYPNVCYEALSVGKEFEILEGTKVVGMGTVISHVSENE